MQEVKKFTFDQKELLEQAFRIRNNVFIKEQNVEREIEYEFEDQAVHYLLLIDGKAVSTGRWRITESGIKLERFATLKRERNKGYGKIILDHILRDVKPLNLRIYLNAQLTAIKFYETDGFVICGDIFEEAGILHKQMEFKKDIPGLE